MKAVLQDDATKLVNIESRRVIRVLKIPIRSASKLELSVSDIFKCICDKATVMEVLDDGNLLRLDFTNYNLDNNEFIRMKKAEDAAKAKAEQEAVAAAQKAEEKAKKEAEEKAAAQKAADEKAKKEAEEKAKAAADKAAKEKAQQ